MNATNFVWLLVGAGFGLMVSQIKGRSRRQVLPPLPELNTSDESSTSEVRSLQEQLRQTELAYSMAAQMSQFKGNFLARTSHELRSPLNGIIGMHQLILSDLADSPEEERDFLSQAHTAALKMIKLLDEVIDAAKVEHGTSKLEIQPIQLTSLLQHVYALTHLQAENRTIQFTLESLQEEIYIAADPRRMQQSLVSLVDSAIAHLQEGHIHLFVEGQPNDDRCYICINTPLSIAAWTENATSFSNDQPVPNSTASKETLLRLNETSFPSTEFVFAIAQSLLRTMEGDVEVKGISGSPSGGVSQIRCMIPLVPFEPSID